MNKSQYHNRQANKIQQVCNDMETITNFAVIGAVDYHVKVSGEFAYRHDGYTYVEVKGIFVFLRSLVDEKNNRADHKDEEKHNADGATCNILRLAWVVLFSHLQYWGKRGR